MAILSATWRFFLASDRRQSMIAIYEIPPFFSHPVSIGVLVLLNSHPSSIHSHLKFLDIELINTPGAYLQ